MTRHLSPTASWWIALLLSVAACNEPEEGAPRSTPAVMREIVAIQPPPNTPQEINPNRVFLGERTDDSGKLTIRYWRCTSSVRQHNNIRCDVDPDFVVVGGGAAAPDLNDDGFEVRKAFLTGSYPTAVPGNDLLRGWVGESKDHFLGFEHELFVVVVGMRLPSTSADTLAANLTTISRTSAESQKPALSFSVPDDSILLSAGARMNYRGAGLLLTDLRADDNTVSAGGKDHNGKDSSGSVTLTALAINRRFISRFGLLDRRQFLTSDCGNGTKSAVARVADGFVGVFAGAASTRVHEGRLLMAASPRLTDPRVLEVTNSDYFEKDEGCVELLTMEIRLL
jgi:hypothetical protein